MNSFLSHLEKTASSGVWAQGRALLKDSVIEIEKQEPDEIVLRVKSARLSMVPRVQLWPKEEDWYCDCNLKQDPCLHVIAAAEAIKQGVASKESSSCVHYHFSSDQNSCLTLIRKSSKGNPIRGSLMSEVSKGLLAGREDLSVDQFIKNKNSFDKGDLEPLFKLLKSAPYVFFEGNKVRVNANGLGIRVDIYDSPSGGLIIKRKDIKAKFFRNGGALYKGALTYIKPHGLDRQAASLLTKEGSHIAPEKIAQFVTETLPKYEENLDVNIEATRIPERIELSPTIQFEIERLQDEGIEVLPKIAYGTIGSIVNQRYIAHDPIRVAFRDYETEKRLQRQLQIDFNMQPGRRLRFHGDEAVQKLRDFENFVSFGNVGEEFEHKGVLVPEIDYKLGGTLFAHFKTKNGQVANTEDVLSHWQEQRMFVPLEGGGYGKIPTDWLEEFGDELDRVLKIQKSNDGQLPPYVCFEIDEWIESSNLIDHFKKDIDVKIPKLSGVTLRPYQEVGIRWLIEQRERGLFSLLADDMGLGKTVQTLAALKGKTLVVAPTSVLSSWRSQAESFRPELKVNLYHGSNRKWCEHSDVTVTSFGLLRLESQEFAEKKWDTIVIDEAQTIKNPNSLIAKAAFALDGKFKVALSGTPVENRLDDLWSIFEFLGPGLLGSQSHFRNKAEQLKNRTKPFILRRIKEEVARDLPPKTELELKCYLSPEEQKIYDTLLGAAREDVQELKPMQILERLLRLRQTVCSPSLVPDTGYFEVSTKIQVLKENLEEVLSEGHKCLVFSQWTKFLDLIEKELSPDQYLRLDGATANREKVVSEFQSKDGPPVMLISLKAGGVGITLTEADYVYIMDPWWNPAVERQAMDRAHRIGQDKPVFVYRLVAAGTIEEKLIEMQNKKKELFDQWVDGAMPLSKEQILELLS